jgi:DNA-binding NtrC family response regulator
MKANVIDNCEVAAFEGLRALGRAEESAAIDAGILLEAGQAEAMIGSSTAMREVRTQIALASSSSAPVMISGESGTGKDLAARTIHELSARRNFPYVAVNCAALPEALIESELFGHERGAFTGADHRHVGCFERANGGTLLLDELVEMKPELQAKLLRVVEEQQVRRLGSGIEIPIDVRVLAATNSNLAAAVRERRLREDLYYRLCVLSFEMPRLCDRPEDIAPMVQHFVRKLTEAAQRMAVDVDAECMAALQQYRWPGNVRQLRNVIERALIVNCGRAIAVSDLPIELINAAVADRGFGLRLGMSLNEVEHELILQTLAFAEGNKKRAAIILGISVRTLYEHLRRSRAVRASALPR